MIKFKVSYTLWNDEKLSFKFNSLAETLYHFCYVFTARGVKNITVTDLTLEKKSKK